MPRANCHPEPPWCSEKWRVCNGCDEQYDASKSYATERYCAECNEWHEMQKAESPSRRRHD